METLLHSPASATKRLGIGRTKLYELMRTGQIESVKVGRARRIPEASLIEYVDRLRQQGAA